jgi:hypothetical protein
MRLYIVCYTYLEIVGLNLASRVVDVTSCDKDSQ